MLRYSIIPVSSKRCSHVRKNLRQYMNGAGLPGSPRAYATFLGYPKVANAEEVEVPLSACMTRFKIRPIARAGETIVMSGQRKQHLMLWAGPHSPTSEGPGARPFQDHGHSRAARHTGSPADRQADPLREPTSGQQ